MASLDVKQKPSFTSLPPEIRNYIYFLSGCLEVKQKRDSTTKSFFQQFSHDSGSMDCPITCTCCYNWSFPALGSPRAAPLSLWVNRKSDYDNEKRFKRQESRHKRCQRHKKIRYLHVTCKRSSMFEYTSIHAKHIDRIAQSALTMVNKQIRMETLPIFYGAQSFLFTIFGRDAKNSVFKWLRTIGQRNASYLRSIKIVYRKKRDRRYIMEELLPSIKKLGVRTEAGVVMAIRFEYPFCYCEGCILNLLGEM